MAGEVATRAGVLVARGTVIAVVMDRSGSMLIMKEEMRAAFAQFIARQQDAPRTCAVNLYQFDDRFETVYEGVLLEAVPPLELEPRGGTALNDAIASAINAVDRASPRNVIMVIITDGEENSSREYGGNSGAAKVASLIRRRRAEGWEFVFLGAGLDDIAKNAGLSAMSFGEPRPALSAASEIALRKRAGES
jgi:hypothetical protein